MLRVVGGVPPWTKVEGGVPPWTRLKSPNSRLLWRRKGREVVPQDRVRPPEKKSKVIYTGNILGKIAPKLL